MQYQRVLCLGDSITYGARATHGRTYPTLLERMLSALPVPSICINAGMNGERSYEIVERAWSYLGSDDWIRICVCLMGTNDSKPGSRTPVPDYIEQWQRLLRMCDCTDTRLLAVEIPAIDPTGQIEYDAHSMPHIGKLNAILHSWANTHDVPVVDHVLSAFMDGRLLDDGIHPNDAGNVFLAQRVYEYLRVPWGARVETVAEPGPISLVQG